MPKLAPYSSVLKLRDEVLNPALLVDMVNLGDLTAAPRKRKKLGGPAARSEVIKDPAAFFDITYPTTEIVETLRVLADRFRRPDEVPGTLLLSGNYGLGKSHVLLAAHHALSAPAVAHAWAARWGIEGLDFPDGVLVHTRSFIKHGKENLWEILVDLVGGKRGLPRSDYPDGQFIEDLLGDAPIVLILDEIERWFDAADPKRQSRNRNFLQALSEVSMRDGRITMLTSVLGEKVEPAETLRRTRPRELSFRSAEDRQRIILFRLFHNRDDANVRAHAADVASAYEAAYTAAGLSDVDTYAARMRSSWPFSPEFLDILTKKIPDNGGFQGTRGTLRFLAEVVRHTHTSRPIVSSQDLPLASEDIKNGLRNLDTGGGEAVRRALGDNYEAVPASLPHKDELFSALLLYSVADPTRPGATREEIVRAVLDPGENPNRITDALTQLLSFAYNLHPENDRYLFKAQENPAARVNAVARSKRVTKEARLSEIDDRLLARWGAPAVIHRDPAAEATARELKAMGRKRPRCVLSTSVLSPEQRLKLQNLDERRNTVVLIEPLVRTTTAGGNYDLYADGALHDQAAQIVACNLLIEGRPDAKAAAYYTTRRKTVRGRLQRAIGERFGRFVMWNRAGATGDPVDDSWFEVPELDDLHHETFLTQLKRDWSGLPDVTHRLKSLWKSFRGRQVSAVVDHFDRTPGLPVPYSEDLVPNAVRALVGQDLFGLDRPKGYVGADTIEACSVDELLEAVLVDPRVVVPPPVSDTLWTHRSVSASYDRQLRGVRFIWVLPDDLPKGDRFRTLVQRYTAPRGWEDGKEYRIDFDSSHGANQYLGEELEHVDTQHLSAGVWYHYYVFLVQESPSKEPKVVLSRKCDVLVPKPETESPDEIEVGPVPSRAKLLQEVEKVVRSPKRMGGAKAIRKIEFRVRALKQLAGLESLASSLSPPATSVEAVGDITLKARGTLSPDNVLALVRKLPKATGPLFGATLYLLREDKDVSEG